MVKAQPHRHCHPAQMHSDECAADVHAGLGLHLLHQHRVGEGLPTAGGPAAARVGLGDSGHDLIPALPGHGAFHHDGPVQMLTALGGQRHALRLQYRPDALQHRLCGLQAGLFADAPAGDLAAGTAHHEQVSGFQMRRLQQFRDGLPRLRGDLCSFHKCHLLFLLYTACQIGWIQHKTPPEGGALCIEGWESI